MEMKVEPYLVSSTVNIAIGQRLVRRICENFKEEISLTEHHRTSLEKLPLAKPVSRGEKVYKGKGCTECNGSGYKGRVCINEVLVADPEIREAILNKASSGEIRKIAIKNGMTTMLDDGFDKIRAGDTTIEEVLRVVHE